MNGVPIYDVDLWRMAIGLRRRDDGPDDVFDEAVLTTEDELRRRTMRAILDDPRGNCRPALFGTVHMAARLKAATATAPHFAAVTGIIERAIIQSKTFGRRLAFPPVLMVSPPGVGKTYYCRRVAQALGTACIPIAINATSDRGQLGGLTPLWRGAKMGRLAKGLLIDSSTNAPLYLLDELDKPPELSSGEHQLDILLSALEPENAAGFRDEYLDVPIALDAALWLASANDVSCIPTPLLDRMLVVEVPWPSKEQSLLIARAIAEVVLDRTGLWEVDDAALELVVSLSPRRMRRALEISCSYAASAKRVEVSAADVREALALMAPTSRHHQIGFVPRAGQGTSKAEQGTSLADLSGRGSPCAS